MLYLGISLYLDEVARLFRGIMPVDDLLGKPHDFVDQFNARAEGVLHGIKLYCLDKMVYALGYTLQGQVRANVFEPAQSIDELCALLQLKKYHQNFANVGNSKRHFNSPCGLSTVYRACDI